MEKVRSLCIRMYFVYCSYLLWLSQPVAQAAKHFNLKLVAPVPATCGDNDCILKDREKDPFEW